MGGAAALQTFESGERVPGRQLGAGRALAPSSRSGSAQASGHRRQTLF